VLGARQAARVAAGAERVWHGGRGAGMPLALHYRSLTRARVPQRRALSLPRGSSCPAARGGCAAGARRRAPRAAGVAAAMVSRGAPPASARARGAFRSGSPPRAKQGGVLPPSAG